MDKIEQLEWYDEEGLTKIFEVTAESQIEMAEWGMEDYAQTLRDMDEE